MLQTSKDIKQLTPLIIMTTPSTDKAAIRQILTALTQGGFNLVSVDNGDGSEKVTTVSAALAEIMATDESHVIMHHPSSDKKVWLFFVLGNSPEEVLCDYTVHPQMDEILDELHKKWEA